MRHAWYDGSGGGWCLIDRSGHARYTRVDLRPSDAESLGDLRHLRGLSTLDGVGGQRHLEGRDRRGVPWPWCCEGN